MLIGLAIIFLFGILISRTMVSKIVLLTAGGPMLLIAKMDLMDSVSTQARFRAIKDAVEQAMAAARGS